VKAIVVFLVLCCALLVAALACEQGSQKQGAVLVCALLAVNVGVIWHVCRSR
jgi:hypothetical protein